jgi:hypothetical protein
MPRPCSICRHPEVAAINAQLVSGETYRNVAKRYGTFSPATVVRHRPHIAKAIAKAKTAAATKIDNALAKQETVSAIKEAGQVETVLDRLMGYHRVLAELLKEAREAKDHAGALRAVQAGLKQLELEARLLGELKDHSGSGTAITVQVVYVNASGASGRIDQPTAEVEPKQILDGCLKKHDTEA